MRRDSIARSWVGLVAVSALGFANAAHGDQKLTEWGLPTSGPYALGTEIGVSGTTALVGALDGVKVFRDFGAGWVLSQAISVPGSPSNIPRIAFEGDVAVFGAPFEDWSPFDSDDEGAAYVFRRSGSSWTQEARLDAGSSSSAYFGSSVAISGNRILIGTTYQGAYVYTWNGTAWTIDQQLLISAPPTSLGNPVAWAGNRALVAKDFGVYVFERTGPPLSPWLPVQLITPSDAGVGFPNFFARDGLAAEGDVVVVGAVHDDDAGTDAGAIYSFRHDGSSFVEEQKVTGDAAGDRFGLDLALRGNDFLVSASQNPILGAPGGAYHYRFDGAAWVRVDDLIPAPVPDSYGISVALGDDQGFVGAPQEGPPCCPNSGFGAVYVWDLALCGDGALDATEECDDGDTTGGDGCNATCEIEDCDNGNDDDGDGFTDFPADPGCRDATWVENPACQNGIDDDAKLGIDFDGGASLNGGVPIASPDPQCATAYRKSEAASSCGLGSEVALLVALVRRMRGRAAGRTP